LDTSKAFDKVLREMFQLHLFRLYVIGIANLLHVLWNNILGQIFGESFSILCGVSQGGVLSPVLFSIYVDDLIKRLRHSAHGITACTVVQAVI